MIVAMPRKSLAIVVLLITVSVRQIDCICISCHLPQNATNKDIERLFIMDFKQRLMQKLGLTEEPKNVVDTPLIILKSIASHGMQAGDQPRREIGQGTKITDIVVAPFQTKPNVSQNKFFCAFQLVEMKGAYEVAGVKLWLHVKKFPVKKHWFQVYDLTRWGRRLVLNQSISSFNSEWSEFKFQPNNAWNKTPWKKLRLEIVGIKDTLNEAVLSMKNNLALLQVLPRPIKRRLVKRSPTRTDDCPTGGQCCKHTLDISLKAQMPWLMMPDRVQAGVCNGTCPALYRSRWAWSMVLQLQNKRQPCCVPTKLSPISTIHQNGKGKIIQTLVEDMVVDSCGCS